MSRRKTHGSSSSLEYGQDLTVGGLNVRSLLAYGRLDKKYAIEQIINQPDLQIDILIVGETWLSDDTPFHTHENIDIRGFTYVRLDRGRGRGGGLLVYFRHGIRHRNVENVFDAQQLAAVESIIFHIDESIRFVLVAIYSPEPNDTSLTALIAKIFYHYYPDYPVMIVGDLNVQYQDVMSMCSMLRQMGHFAQPIVEGPTHVNGNCIDHIITNIHEVPKGTDVEIIARGVVQINHTPGTPGYISDHNLVWCRAARGIKPKKFKKSLTMKVSSKNLPKSQYHKQLTEKSAAENNERCLQKVTEIKEEKKGTKTSGISQTKLKEQIEKDLLGKVFCKVNNCYRLLDISELGQHVQSKHFQCPECRTFIKIKTNASKHLKKKHGIFMCRSTKCKKLFDSEQERIDHENDGNHFVCDQCDVSAQRAFTAERGLNEHIRMKTHPPLPSMLRL